VLLLNDHYLKGAALLTPLVTGKLSDFAGLMMAPVVLAAMLAPGSRRVFVLSHLAVGSVFTALKLSAACSEAWSGLGAELGMKWRVVSDASDLLALPMLGISNWLFGARRHVTRVWGAWRSVVTRLASGVGLVGIVATSRLPPRPPVLTPSAVYVPVGDKLQQLARETGKVERRIDCDMGGWRQQPQVVGDVLYTIHVDDIAACDLRAGRRLWQRKRDAAHGLLPARVEAAPALPAWPGAIVATASSELLFTHQEGCVDNSLIARLRGSGQALWRIPWCPVEQAATADEDLLVTYGYAANGGVVTARELRSGRVRWFVAVEP
jgi:hypothetical protein